jgi:hypothetical protein
MKLTDRETKNNSICEEQLYLAAHELSSFIAAVTELFGSEQARFSEKDWLEELELMDSRPLSTNQQWRVVTIAASARLSGRLSIIAHHAGSQSRADTKGVVDKEIKSDNTD